MFLSPRIFGVLQAPSYLQPCFVCRRQLVIRGCSRILPLLSGGRYTWRSWCRPARPASSNAMAPSPTLMKRWESWRGKEPPPSPKVSHQLSCHADDWLPLQQVTMVRLYSGCHGRVVAMTTKSHFKTRKCILVGYGELRKGYRLYDTDIGTIFYGRDVHFNFTGGLPLFLGGLVFSQPAARGCSVSGIDYFHCM